MLRKLIKYRDIETPIAHRILPEILIILLPAKTDGERTGTQAVG